MKLANHPHVCAISEAMSRYRQGEIDVEGLRATLSGVAAAMEGDLPRSLRDAVTEAEADVDGIQFTLEDDEMADAVEKALSDVFRLIQTYAESELPLT